MGASHLGNRWLRSRGSRDGYCVCDLSHRYARAGVDRSCRAGSDLVCERHLARTSKAGNYPRRPGDPRLVPDAAITTFNIKIIRIDEFRRYGRLVRLLEIETVSGGLLILSRWDLGTDPVEVLDALTAAGYAGRGQR